MNPALAALLSGAPDPDAHQTPARPHPEAQRMELRDRFIRAQVCHAFEPGDLVRQKRGLGAIANQDTHQLVFWCWFDRENPMHVAALHSESDRRRVEPDTDCFVALLADDGNRLRFFLVASSGLEPDTEAQS